LRVATFKLENFDDKPGKKPTLDERIAVMRPQLLRHNVDVLVLQEVNGQEEPGQPRRLPALERLLETTPYAGYHMVSTITTDGAQGSGKLSSVDPAHLVHSRDEVSK
jgi:endonuclease/exonuclease/phosphatase family metal-dependent hydrolase